MRIFFFKWRIALLFNIILQVLETEIIFQNTTNRWKCSYPLCLKFRISHVFLPYLYVSLAWFVLNRVLVVVFQNGGTLIRNDANSVKEFFKQFFIEKSIRTVVSVVQTANILQEYHINIKSGLRDGVKAEKRHIITRSPACSAPEVHVNLYQ